MAFLLAGAAGSDVRADVPEDTVIARVGSQTVTAGELTKRLLSVPPFQLRAFGKTEEEIKRNFLERVMVRDLLLSQGSVDQKLDATETMEERVRATLRSAMVQQIRLEAQANPISDEEVAKFYKDNEDKFRAPERFNVWRILVATKEDALKVVEETKKDNSAKRWSDLARERSMDKATNMRGGNLGYVSADGKTSDSMIAVDSAVMDRVKLLKDGELSTEPVKEGDKWAVIWKRQTMKAVERPLEQEATGIRQTIARQRVEQRMKALIEKGRTEQVKDLNLELADEVTVSAQGDLQPQRRPGVLPSRRGAPGLPQPGGHDHR